MSLFIHRNSLIQDATSQFGYNIQVVSQHPQQIYTYLQSNIQQLVYLAYVHTPGVCMILDMHALTCTLIFFPMIFLKFSKFFWFWFFKNLMLYICPLIYLFVLERDRFFTLYICFQGTLFFNFSYKLFNKYFSLPQSTQQFRVSVRK